ncbi:MAG: beta-lysine 5,6-aminomutase alpha subunit [Actinomycetota bacterium]|jgi:beta-lysine 5,6-aminomutase alpha subunit|nr:beta-lysine 5,6-aminomutase alpha subunit [Actinomycetota bacterium]
MNTDRRFVRPVGRLLVDRATIDECRDLAAQIAAPIDELACTHTTNSIERASLRLGGVDGVEGQGTEAIPIPNRVVDEVAAAVGLERGVLIPFWHAVESGGEDVDTTARRIAGRAIQPTWPEGDAYDTALSRAQAEARAAVERIAGAAERRRVAIEGVGEAEKPWLYLIVATGNIYEDIPQAQAAARNGADVIAVIRSTGQSLIDYVPYGATTEGFAGTFATQENFRLMRQALDEVGEELGRYIRLTNYASGLCMPEIATMAATERLDMMLNDCMYGIIFRDINMQRTFIDQHFSRMVHALADIVINTGEDNYLTTANAIDAAHTVLASQFLNERLAISAGLRTEQMGLGHAFEIDPKVPDQILLELAHAQLIRECFPDAPLKYMPPTKHMTGNIFLGFLYDGMFNLVGALTGQDIILLGMMTEGSHTPFLSDRHLALENANYVFGGAAGLAGELRFEPGGDVERRAAQVLEECRQMLQKVGDIGMFEAIEAGMFGDTVRLRDGGKGLSGVVRRHPAYVNPISDLLAQRLGVS